MFTKILKITGISLLAILIISYVYVKLVSRVEPPEVPVTDIVKAKVVTKDNNFYSIGNCWLKESETGIWELYIEGSAFERGVIIGKLTKDLIRKQEEIFVSKVKEFVPSPIYRSFLQMMIEYFNRNLDSKIPDEYLKEIYGISLSASKDFNRYGSPYMRILNYHAAHDIGHALADYSFVGCTSFSYWDVTRKDTLLITGRNFDFSIGDEFAEDKIVAFFAPDEGNKFAFVTWGGMIGVVSGMNCQGISVTINAAKSELPISSSTPISILTREILQYAGNIDEAVKIAKKRQTFVSESILVSSASDGKTIIIEKTPLKEAVVFPDSNYIICTNHFRSRVFSDTSLPSSTSKYRYKRVKELFNRYDSITPEIAASILRNRKGLNDADIGNGNEKAINQLIAHHSVLFDLYNKIMWVSANPYNLGKYVAYDLNKVFKDYNGLKENKEIYNKELSIPTDTFLFTNDYQQFIKYKSLRKKILKATDKSRRISADTLKLFRSTNPEYFELYLVLGDYYKSIHQYNKAIDNYNIALSKEIDSENNEKKISENLEACLENAKR